jgi:tRNA-2-methylthio-N6-dimethylallyladenosine synthase
MKKVLVHTFGCQMNAHDSRRIEEALAAGYEPTDLAEHADLIVLNTCSVREKAEHKLVSALGRLRPLKQENPDLRIVVAGCMAQEHGPALLDRLDLVDVMVGPDNIPELPGLVLKAQAGGRHAAVALDEAPRFLQAESRPLRPGQASEVTAYVTVMKGCDERCSYCIVPYTRGIERYRAADDIVAEIARLVAGGVREVTLLGQTVNSWHEPTVQLADDEESQFPELLRRIARDVPALARLRYTSPHPRHLTAALIAAHAELAVLPAHVHLPVQSGSDRVLKRMIRRYRRDEYIERTRALKAARPGLTLATDIIVGFPGETEEDFEQTLSLCEAVGFITVFGFKYSPRPHTPALKLDDDVPEAVKADRLERLFTAVDVHQRRHLDALVGARVQVLFEGPSKAGNSVSGRTERHEIVHVEIAPEHAHQLTGQLADVLITQANKRSLAGRLLDMPAPSAPRRPPSASKSMRLPVVSS